MCRPVYARQFPVHVGVDAGKSFHKLVACGADGVRTKAHRVEVSREGFESALTFLRETCPQHVMQTGEAFDQRRWMRNRVDPALLPEQAA